MSSLDTINERNANMVVAHVRKLFASVQTINLVTWQMDDYHFVYKQINIIHQRNTYIHIFTNPYVLCTRRMFSHVSLSRLENVHFTSRQTNERTDTALKLNFLWRKTNHRMAKIFLPEHFTRFKQFFLDKLVKNRNLLASAGEIPSVAIVKKF